MGRGPGAVFTNGNKRSITIYTGNEGEEKALDTYNLNFDGNQISRPPTLTMTWTRLNLGDLPQQPRGLDHGRLETLVTNLFLSATRVSGGVDAAPGGVFTNGNKRSITIYTGNEGEEKALDTYNLNFDGNQISRPPTLTMTWTRLNLGDLPSHADLTTDALKSS